MSIAHGYQSHLEIMSAGHFLDLVGIIIGHQEVAFCSFTEREQLLMIQIEMTVKAFARFLAPCCIWRVDEEYDVLAARILLTEADSICD